MNNKNNKQRKPKSSNNTFSRGNVSRGLRFNSNPNQTVGLPNEMIYRTSYATIRLLTSATVQAFRLHTNDCYDVDPAVASTNSVGFSEIIAFYKSFRVLSYKYTIDIANLDINPVIVYILNLNFDPTTSITNHYAYARNPNCYTFMVPGVGGNATKRTSKAYTVERVYGKPITDEFQFLGTDSTSPSNLTWLAMSVQSANGAPIVNGVSANITLTQQTLFFERKVLIT